MYILEKKYLWSNELSINFKILEKEIVKNVENKGKKRIEINDKKYIFKRINKDKG